MMMTMSFVDNEDGVMAMAMMMNTMIDVEVENDDNGDGDNDDDDGSCDDAGKHGRFWCASSAALHA